MEFYFAINKVVSIDIFHQFDSVTINNFHSINRVKQAIESDQKLSQNPVLIFFLKYDDTKICVIMILKTFFLQYFNN